jgi:hypothetical protein
MNRSMYCAAAFAVVVSLSGCSMFEDDDDDRQTVTDMSMYGGVPSNAIRGAQGFDTVRYRASEPARIWIGNDSRRMVVTDTRVQAGDEIVVNAGGDSVTVNGRVIYNQDLKKNEQHSIFVVPERAPN